MHENLQNLKLPKKPSQETFKLLIRAKLLFENALSHSVSLSGVSPLLAIHGYDNVIEFLLRIIADHIEYETISGDTFPDSELKLMAGALNKILKNNLSNTLPYFSQIKTLRQVRNLVQHGGIDPGTDLKRFTTITKGFFEISVHMFFGIDPDNLEISEIIDNVDVKFFLCKAEKQLEKGLYLDSIVNCRDAFDNTLYQKYKKLNHKIDPIPMIVESEKKFPISKWFFESISEGVNLLKFGIVDSRYQEYNEIINHIPNNHCVDDKNYKVMSRDWTIGDARFCYSFVSNQILKWQNEDLKPFIEYEDSLSNYSCDSFIDDICLTDDQCERTLTYFIDSSLCIFLYHIDDKTKRKTEKLKKGNSYQLKDKNYKGKKLENVIKCKSIIEFIQLKVITHNPIRWEIVLSAKQIPFTWSRIDYKLGKVVERSLNINKATISQLISKNSIDESIAKKIVSLRKSIDKISTEKQLWNIEGITKEQVEWLVNFTEV